MARPCSKTHTHRFGDSFNSPTSLDNLIAVDLPIGLFPYFQYLGLPGRQARLVDPANRFGIAVSVVSNQDRDTTELLGAGSKSCYAIATALASNNWTSWHRHVQFGRRERGCEGGKGADGRTNGRWYCPGASVVVVPFCRCILLPTINSNVPSGLHLSSCCDQSQRSRTTISRTGRSQAEQDTTSLLRRGQLELR